jgi:hypothetical protein
MRVRALICKTSVAVAIATKIIARKTMTPTICEGVWDGSEGVELLFSVSSLGDLDDRQER